MEGGTRKGAEGRAVQADDEAGDEGEVGGEEEVGGGGGRSGDGDGDVVDFEVAVVVGQNVLKIGGQSEVGG